MELCIRSQDKNLLMPINDIISVFQKSVFYRGIILGQYKSEERALQVLDEIQEHIENQGQSFAESNGYGIVINYKYYGNVYIMPKE